MSTEPSQNKPNNLRKGRRSPREGADPIPQKRPNNATNDRDYKLQYRSHYVLPGLQADRLNDTPPEMRMRVGSAGILRSIDIGSRWLRNVRFVPRADIPRFIRLLRQRLPATRAAQLGQGPSQSLG